MASWRSCSAFLISSGPGGGRGTGRCPRFLFEFNLDGPDLRGLLLGQLQFGLHDGQPELTRQGPPGEGQIAHSGTAPAGATGPSARRDHQGRPEPDLAVFRPGRQGPAHSSPAPPAPVASPGTGRAGRRWRYRRSARRQSGCCLLTWRSWRCLLFQNTGRSWRTPACRDKIIAWPVHWYVELSAFYNNNPSDGNDATGHG